MESTAPWFYYLIKQNRRLPLLVFSPTALRINEMFVVDLTSVVGENTNNGEHRERAKSLDSLLDHIQSEAAAVGVFTNSYSHL